MGRLVYYVQKSVWNGIELLRDYDHIHIYWNLLRETPEHHFFKNVGMNTILQLSIISILGEIGKTLSGSMITQSPGLVDLVIVLAQLILTGIFGLIGIIVVGVVLILLILNVLVIIYLMITGQRWD